MPQTENYTTDQIKAILMEIIASIGEPDNYIKLNTAKETAGNEMLKMMQIIFPMIVQIESEVIRKYGFHSGREGMVRFTQIVSEMERVDPEVARLHGDIRSHFLPPVSIPSTFHAAF